MLYLEFRLIWVAYLLQTRRIDQEVAYLSVLYCCSAGIPAAESKEKHSLAGFGSNYSISSVLYISHGC